MLRRPPMPIRLLRRAAVLVAAAAVFLFLPSVARAQGLVILQKESLPRILGDQPITKRPSGLKPEGISHQDCIDDQKIRFSMQLAAPEPGASLQVWAGLGGASNCHDQTSRSGSNATCWPVVPGIPLEVSPVVDIPVRAIMAGAPPFKPVEPAQGDEMCGRIDLATISVQVLYFSPGQLAQPSRSDEVSLEVDTVGPAPPSGLRTLPGNQRIVVEWQNISGEGGVSLLTGVRAYCDVAGGGPQTPEEPSAPENCEEVPVEGDAGEDAGTTLVCDDAGAPPPQAPPGAGCSSPNLSSRGGEPIVPDEAFNQKYECGSLFGSTGASLVATGAAGRPLENGTRYAVAVAATDDFANVGPLSGVVCEHPEQTNDFWENYKEAGGTAGGGLCAATNIGAPAGSASALALAALAAGSILRRRSRR